MLKRAAMVHVIAVVSFAMIKVTFLGEKKLYSSFHTLDLTIMMAQINGISYQKKRWREREREHYEVSLHFKDPP